MRETAKLAILLAAICSVCGAMLVSFDKATRTRREQSAASREISAAATLFGIGDGDLSSIERRDDLGAFVVRDASNGGAFAGAAIRCSSPNGYGGDVKLLVAFGSDGSLKDFTVLESHETPGLGANISKPEFHAQFKGRPSDIQWKVRNDGGDIDAVTSATISSRAVCEAIADAAAKFRLLASAIE